MKTKKKIAIALIWGLAIALALFMLSSCRKQDNYVQRSYVQTIKASFFELDSTQSVVVKQYDMLGKELAEQEFKVRNLDFQADMIVKNEIPSIFIMYLKDEYGHLVPLETRPLK
jgi:hypothetical protein